MTIFIQNLAKQLTLLLSYMNVFTCLLSCVSNSLLSLFFILQRLMIAREFNDRAAERRAFSNLGNAHVFLGEFEIAAEYYKYVNVYSSFSL